MRYANMILQLMASIVAMTTVKLKGTHVETDYVFVSLFSNIIAFNCF